MKMVFNQEIFDALKEGMGRTRVSQKFGISTSDARGYVWVFNKLKGKNIDEASMESLISNAYNIIKKELKKPCRMGHLSRKTGLSKEKVKEILDRIEQETGLPVEIEDGNVTINKFMGTAIEPLNIPKQYKRELTIGLVSDTHFASKYQQRTLLQEAYNIMDSEGVSFCVHAGDVVDGSPRMHAGMLHELFLHTFEEQIDYAKEFYPVSKSFKTYVRPGNHDYSWMKSDAGDPVRMICKDREDLIYLHPSNSAFKDKDDNTLIELFHPSGGMPYSLSYRGQKLFESTVGKALSEYNRTHKLELPHILAIGHLHKYNHFLDGFSNVFLLPCFQAQTEYLRNKGLSPMVGFIICKFTFDDEGHILRIDPSIYDFTSKTIDKDY